jgi:membrane associated rhomboid family serine protease
MWKIQYDKSNREVFPSASIGLLLLFYLIGVLTYDGHSLSEFGFNYISKNIINPDIRTLLALYPVLELQWQLFTYHLIHFGLIHYGYSGFLILYYITTFERATNKMTIILGYFLFAILWPLIGGIIFFIMVYFSPDLIIYLQDETHENFLGSSIGIWGLIGLASASQYKRRFYWPPVVLLLFFEFALKIIVGRDDLATNVLHVMVYLGTWVIGRVFIEIEGNDGKVGGFRSDRKLDYYLFGFIIINIIIMLWHMIYVNSISN